MGAKQAEPARQPARTRPGLAPGFWFAGPPPGCTRTWAQAESGPNSDLEQPAQQLIF